MPQVSVKRVFTLFALLCVTSASANAPDRSIQWAQRDLNLALCSPIQWGDDYRPDWYIDSARDNFKWVLRKYGPDARAYAGLAQCQLLLGDCKGAVESYQRAIRLDRSDKRLWDALGLARQYKWVSGQAIKLLPIGRSVLRVVRCPGERDKWLVLSAVVRPSGVAQHDYTDVQLTAYQKANAGLHEICASDTLGKQKDWEDARFHSVSLILVDMTGHGAAEIVIPKTWAGGSSTPAHIDVFHWRNGRITKLLGARSQYGIRVRELNGDSSYEIISLHSIGWELSHAEQPGWPDIFAYKNGTYQLANGDFSRYYQDVARTITAALKTHPNDWELLKYQGIIHQIEGNPTQAQSAFSRAAAQLAKRRNKESDPVTCSWMDQEIADITQRTQSLN